MTEYTIEFTSPISRLGNKLICYWYHDHTVDAEDEKHAENIANSLVKNYRCLDFDEMEWDEDESHKLEDYEDGVLPEPEIETIKKVESVEEDW